MSLYAWSIAAIGDFMCGGRGLHSVILLGGAATRGRRSRCADQEAFDALFFSQPTALSELCLRLTPVACIGAWLQMQTRAHESKVSR